MIVTRRRRKPFPWKRVLPAAIAIALLVGVFAWAPSRNWIAKQPVMTPVMKPFDAVGQMQTINSQNAQIASLQKQLEDARNQIADGDKQISGLQTQLNSAQQEAALAQAAKPQPRATPVQSGTGTASTAAQNATDLSSQATPDMRRTADVWAAMDAESAAKVVQKLPDDYVARIFALMSPDSVGAILENLPPAYAARLTRDRPELAH